MIQLLKLEQGSRLVEEALPSTIRERERMWRELINIRPPVNVSSEYLSLEDTFLTQYHHQYQPIQLAECHITNHPNIYTYHGDIRHLEVDGIVNAANSEMIGCFIPNHGCIDNAIHTYAGVRLRLACHHLMTVQGRKEPVGQAKITKAYHLPASHIIHTVGPSVQPGRKVSAIRQDLLKRCYQSCLDLALKEGLHSLAFCAISTGEFAFPKQLAATIAVDTVKQWLRTHDDKINVIFNTFTQEDKRYYHQLLRKEE